MSQSHQNRYSASLMFLHWLVFILIVATYIIINVRGYLPEDDSMRAILMGAHKSIGVALFAIIVVRLFVRWNSSYPPISPPVSKMYYSLVVLGHYALYALLLIMSISGYLMSSAAGREVAFLGWGLPNLVGHDEVLSQNMYDLHVWSSQLIYVLVGFHIFMALWHHFVRKDNTLVRMLPLKSDNRLKVAVKSSAAPVSLPSIPLDAPAEITIKPTSANVPNSTSKTVAKPKVPAKSKAESEAKVSATGKAVKSKTATTKATVKPKEGESKPKDTVTKPKAEAKKTTVAKPKTASKTKTATTKSLKNPRTKAKVESKKE